MGLNRTLEQLIDMDGLVGIIDRIGQICAEKASHVAENWQDGALSGEWQVASERLQGVAAKIPDFL